MKIKKMLGAVVLSAALAMGTVGSAFAVNTTDAGVGAPESDWSTGTVVSLGTYESGSLQISVTVPLNMTIVAPSAGGAVWAPSAGAYQIVNASSKDGNYVPVNLTAAATELNANVNLVESITDTDEPAASGIDLVLTLTPQLAGTDAWNLAATDFGTPWQLPADATTAVDVAGVATVQEGTLINGTGVGQVIQITYTVEEVA